MREILELFAIAVESRQGLYFSQAVLHEVYQTDTIINAAADHKFSGFKHCADTSALTVMNSAAFELGGHVIAYFEFFGVNLMLIISYLAIDKSTEF